MKTHRWNFLKRINTICSGKPLPVVARRWKWILVCLACIPFILGAVVMVGWLGRYEALIQVGPNLVPMQFNTALAAFLAGITALSFGMQCHRFGLIASAIGLVLSFSTLMQYFCGINFGVDTLFVNSWITVHSPALGRMALNTSIAFSLLFAATFVSCVSKDRRLSFLATICYGIALGFSLIALFGYAVGLPSVVGWLTFSQMSPQTALSIFGASIALLILNKPAKVEIRELRRWLISLSCTLLLTLIVCLLIAMKVESVQSAHNGSANSTIGANVSKVTWGVIILTLLMLAALVYQIVLVSNQKLLIGEMYRLKVSAFNAMIDGLVVIDSNGNILETNEAFCDIFECDPSDIVGVSIEIIIPETEGPSGDIHWKRYLLHHQIKHLGGRRLLHAKNMRGEIIPIFLQVSVGERNGSIIYIGVIHNVSERLLAEQNAEHRQQILQAAMSSSSSGFVVYQVGGQILEMNEQARQWLSISGEESAVSFYQLFSDSYRELIQSESQRICEAKYGQVCEDILLKPNGMEERWVLLNVAIVPRVGETPYCIASFTDITQIKKLAQVLERKNVQLGKLNAELDDFAYVASHDLKSPLRGIRQSASWIEEDLGTVSPEIGEHLELLTSRVTRMENLLSDLLSYSRVGHVSMPMEVVQVESLLADIVGLLPRPPEYQFLVSSTVSEIVTCQTIFSQVIRNLVDNSLKHRLRDDGFVRIIVSETDADYVVKVEDNGPGIAEKYREKVFQIFGTLRPRDEVEGSGMGLSIVKKIMDKVGGSVVLSPKEALVDEEEVRCRIELRWPKNPPAMEPEERELLN